MKADTITRAERQSVCSFLGYQRLYLNMTRRQLANRSGVSVRTIHDYETGKKDMKHMRTSKVYALCTALGLTMNAIRLWV